VVLYEDLPEDGEIVSFNQAADGDGAFEICQSEDGYVGNVQQNSQGESICDTKDGAKDSFYVLQLAEGADDGEAGGLAAKFHEKHGTGQPEMGELPPAMQFDFTDEEKIEIGEAMAETDAIKRMIEECAGADRPDTCGPKPKQGVWTNFQCSNTGSEDVGRAAAGYGCIGVNFVGQTVADALNVFGIH
jgi:hypothetical protein